MCLWPSGKGKKKDKKGRTSPDRETPLFETPPVQRPSKQVSRQDSSYARLRRHHYFFDCSQTCGRMGTSNQYRGQKINANFFCTKFFENPSGHGRPRQKSWTSAPKNAFFCGPGDAEKLFDPGSSGRKGQERPREIRTKKFMFMLFFLPGQ